MTRSATRMRLPLFPLRTVLFPGGVLPLKVFEQRYVEMTKACLADERPFGVCMITDGDEVARPGAGPPKFASIGTTARIADWDMPQLGILHLRTIGDTRFVVEAHEVEPTGLVVADVRLLDAEPRLPVPEGFDALVRLLELIAARVGPANFPTETDYADATWVGYRLAEFMPLPAAIKQTMLEVNDASVRLDVLRRFLREQGVV